MKIKEIENMKNVSIFLAPMIFIPIGMLISKVWSLSKRVKQLEDKIKKMGGR